MKHQEEHLPTGNTGDTGTLSPIKSQAALAKGFAKVVAGGRIVRLQKDKPFLERMVLGEATPHTPVTPSRTHAQAVMESVATNLEAGIELIDHQEVCLAKMGGRLSEIALSLNQVRSPQSDDQNRQSSQRQFESSRDEIRRLSQSTYDNTALFSQGVSKPITIAVPNLGSAKIITPAAL